MEIAMKRLSKVFGLALAPQLPYLAVSSVELDGRGSDGRFLHILRLPEGEGSSLPIVASIPSPSSLRRIGWSGGRSDAFPLGLVAGGFEESVLVWNPAVQIGNSDHFSDDYEADSDHEYPPDANVDYIPLNIPEYADDPDDLAIVERHGPFRIIEDYMGVFWLSHPADKNWDSKKDAGWNLTAATAHGNNEGNQNVIVKLANHHRGPVLGLGFCDLQPHLLASGALDEKLCVYDLNQLSNHVNPIPTLERVGPTEAQISHLSWHHTCPHLLVCTCHSGVTRIWDLRQESPCADYVPQSPNLKCSAVHWKPDDCNIFALASEKFDESFPLLAFDARKLNRPLKEFSGTKGVLALSWCQNDSDLLLTSNADRRVVTWSYATAKVVHELPPLIRGDLGVNWCSTSGVFAASSSTSEVGLYRLPGA